VTSTGNIAATGTGADGILSVSGACCWRGYGELNRQHQCGLHRIEGESFLGGAVTVTSTRHHRRRAWIFARSELSGSGDVTVTSTGSITATGGFGIYASSTNGHGAVTVTSTGNIATNGFLGIGIIADNNSNAAVTVTSTGNIATTGTTRWGFLSLALAR